MAETPTQSNSPNEAASSQSSEQLERGTYEIIRNRLKSHGGELQNRLEQLNEERREVFGSIPTQLISTQRVTTEYNCTAQDIAPVGPFFIFGYNVHMGLKTVTALADVFTVYQFGDDGLFHEAPLDLIQSGTFEQDFFQLYKYYKDTRFIKFHHIGPHLYFVFQIGKSVTDTKAFKFLVKGDSLTYLDNRSDHEVVFPPQHDFKWIRTHRDLHRGGLHPHISIEDRVFVETVGGDLTIKIEDNTADGEGIYREPVDDRDQTLDDAEVFYSIVGNLILLKIRPFKETQFRYLIFNEKTQTVQRMDSIADACIGLPEDHGLIFSRGYYLQTGVSKTFDNGISDLLFERRINSPNGEDYLYVFHNRVTGQNVLLSYNMIEQAIETPILCNGFSIFENGHLIYFRSEATPQKHHAIQIWQTPYVGENVVVAEKMDSYIFKIGNKEIVRAMSECHEILNLIDQNDSYSNLYEDLVKKTSDILDSYFWLKEPQAYGIAEPLRDILAASTAAVDEFDKVVRVRENTRGQFDATSAASRNALSAAVSKQFRHINDFVVALASLRTVRGSVISLKELKYIDLPAVEALETKISENAETLSRRCVDFLLKENSLVPYADRVTEQRNRIESLKTGVEARKLGEEIAASSSELEMLIDIVSNLKIDDANQRTRIIDNISVIYSNLNQTRATLRKKSQSLLAVEGEAEFNSQIKLVSQAVANYLDVCDTPERCDEYLTKLMVQIEEIEGRFAEFDDFIIQIAEKREQIYAAFDTQKLQIVEARNKRATALMSAADRILNGIRSRALGFKTVDEINSYFAADLMIEKVRDLISQLSALEESVKVDDIQSRLKTIREDTVRQLRDKNELFVDGQNVIQFGKHKFSVNTQVLDLTTVIKDGQMWFHLSGTNYFERIEHAELNATRSVWDQAVVSENRDVYRAEYLAFRYLRTAKTPAAADFLESIQQFMATRYSEGYIKGVHDHDAALILKELQQLDQNLGLLKYASSARAIARLFWFQLGQHEPEPQKRWSAKLRSLGAAGKLFGEIAHRESYVQQLARDIGSFVETESLDVTNLVALAARYLFDQLTSQSEWVCSGVAATLLKSFRQHLQESKATESFEQSIMDPSLSIVDRFLIARNWLAAFQQSQSSKQKAADDSTQESTHEPAQTSTDEVACMLIDRTAEARLVMDIEPARSIVGLLGDHPRVEAKTYHLDYHEFMTRLERFENETVPAYESYLHLKKTVVQQRRSELKLEEFKPTVLTSFVRNELINRTYLPMVGANLAKQIGVVGENKRTDLSGLLLLVSPPGYGKTTLMEYIANRLGITFMKINGPAIGHAVTSLDPAEAPNASAREEIHKLNLALEMGDNVMIYVDDIQHCNPEFLQKFISLCDATRRIEGVWGGRTRTYDLRGRKVAVVMAGNPYTESGDKFQIPDMLASRADTYNLGDVIGDNLEPFEMSYLENCLTSNPVLARLGTRSQSDIHNIIKMARQPNASGITLEGSYSIEEVNEFVAVMRKLLVARDVILKVNREYIDSAAQADAYRTEPPFKLQGSYRDMNKIAEAISPIMNDDELNTLIQSHYQNQAQTLTSGAQANLLKLRSLLGTLAGEDLQRWEDIIRTFKRNLLLGSASDDNQLGMVIAQMTTFSEGLHDIRTAMSKGVSQLIAARGEDGTTIQTATLREVGHAVAELAKFNSALDGIRNAVETGLAGGSAGTGGVAGPAQQHNIEVINKVPNIFLDVIRNQFRVMQTWMGPILQLAEAFPEAEGLKRAAVATEKNYERLIKQIGAGEVEVDSEAESGSPAASTIEAKAKGKNKGKGKS